MPDRKEQPLPCETMPAHELVAARYSMSCLPSIE